MAAAVKDVVEILKSRALVKGVRVTLASGRESDVYVDCKRATLHGPSLRGLGRAIWDRLKAIDPEVTHVAGVSVGGDPLVAAVALAAFDAGRELEALLVRKEKKAHGMAEGRAVDGAVAANTRRVWLVEDVISTGGSSDRAAQNLKGEGYPLVGILALVDREMGGIESLRQKFGVPVETLCRLSDLG